MKRYSLFLVFLSMLLLAVDLPLASAQDQGSVTLDARAGFDGAYRSGEWFPVIVTVSNTGADINGVLQWRFAGRPDEPTFEYAIDLPRNSRKRVTMYAYANDLVRSGQLRLLQGSTSIAEFNQPLEAIDQERLLIGVISSDQALLNNLNQIRLPNITSSVVRHLQLADLPEHIAALRTLDVLFLHDTDTSTITTEQLNALRLWVQLGGQLIVSGGSNGHLTAAGLGDLLPAQVTSSISSGSLSGLSELASTPPPAENVTLSELQPKAKANGIPAQDPLLYRSNEGTGIVTVTRFDISSLRSWTSEVELWSQLIVPIAQVRPGQIGRLQFRNLLQQLLRRPSFNWPSTGVLLLFLLLYIVIIGPVNYFVLKRMKRMELAWVSIPIIVLLFSGGLYLAGFGLRGTQSQTYQVSVVQGSENGSHGLVTSYVGLFSPRRTSYSLQFAPSLLVNEAHSWNDFNNETVRIVQSEQSVQVPDLLVDIGSVRTMSVEGMIPMELQVQSQLQINERTIMGSITNNSGIELENALLVRGNQFQMLGTLASGNTHEINITTSSSFPWGVSIPRNDAFDQQQMLTLLFDSGATTYGHSIFFTGEIFDPDSVYLLGWAPTHDVAMLVNGQPTTPTSTTLYVIRLNNEGAVPLSPLPTPQPTNQP